VPIIILWDIIAAWFLSGPDISPSMRELEMHNGEVRDARECPDCGRQLARDGDALVCYNCNERYEVSPSAD